MFPEVCYPSHPLSIPIIHRIASTTGDRAMINAPTSVAVSNGLLGFFMLDMGPKIRAGFLD